MICFSQRALITLQALIFSLSAGFAVAQTETYPSRPVKLIVPFAPGGSADMLARVLAEGLSKGLGQSFQVENKAGATGVIGTTEVARAKPDGHTLLYTPASTLAQLRTALPQWAS